MTSSRRFLIFLVMLLTFPVLARQAVAAQNQDDGPGPGSLQGRGRGGPGRGPISVDDRIKMLTKQLDLTADQQTKLKPILEDQQKKMQELRNGGDTDRRVMREKIMAIQKESNEQIHSVLDDMQKTKYDKMLEAQQQRGRGQRGPGGQGSPDRQAPPPSPQN